MLTAKKALAGEINGLAEQLLAENRVDDAVALFNLASREEPDNGQYANNLAIARFQAGDVAGAVGDLERALRTEGDRRLFTLNFADLALTSPRLLRRGLAVCGDYLAANGDDAEVATAAANLADALATANAGFLAAVAEMPEHAKMKVNGAAAADHLVAMGELLATCIVDNLPELAGARTVLDFGVGIGRVLWPLSQILPQARFVGFDVDPMMLTSLAGVAAVADTELVATTQDLPDDSIDAAYVISVFTHLTDTTDYWLWELNRVLAPGGRALISYHDETLYDENAVRVGSRMRCRGRMVLGSGSEGSTAVGTFYETAAWERLIGRFFKVIRTVPRGVCGHQSFSIVEKAETRVDSLGIHRTYLRDLERELYEMRRQANLEI